ncbi:MAG: dipeptidase [Pseudomonadota bacterium]
MLKQITLAAALLCAGAAGAATPSQAAIDAAKYASAHYQKDIVATLARLVSYNTVANDKIAFADNPAHQDFKRYLKAEAARLGFDFADHGYVVVIGLGQGSERLGIITHGDVQPVDPSKWVKSPFELDGTSVPGQLVARGAEDDKGPIASALYAMKAIKDRKITLRKRIELYVYMGEESDWDPLIAFLKTHTPPQMNITLDAEYPAVTAEKGWGLIGATFPLRAATGDAPMVSAFGGGFFASQIPEDAHASIANATPALEAAIRARAATQAGMAYQFAWSGSTLNVTGKGHAAHSSKPEDGVNAIAMVADALAVHAWPDAGAGGLVNFINELLGTGLYGEKFGTIAYRDTFMGPMTVSPTVLKQTEQGIALSINVRRPQGKDGALLEKEVRSTLDQWQARHAALADIKVQLTEPWLQKDAPQLPTLMGVFAHFTGVANPQPISIGGGTNSRLFPHAVSFGPAMPKMVYTGHSEHEFITRDQLLLNLKMYTAVMVELAH